MVRSYNFPTYIFSGRDEERQYWSFDWMASKRKIIQCDRLDSTFSAESCGVFSSFFWFFLFYFYFFFHTFQGGRRQNLLFMRQMSLFTHYSGTVYALFMGITTTLLKKILKMGPTVLFTHLKIILLQYFQFLVFNFSNNKFNLNRPNR